jgi:hypothetical protein
MSGCAICVHDLYAEALTEYQTSLDALRTTLHSRGVSEDKWPESIRHHKADAKPQVNPTMSAFEQLEKMLAEKQAKRSAEEAKATGACREQLKQLQTTHGCVSSRW